MAASDVGSWLEVDPQTDTGSCCSWLKIFGAAKALTWWRDTTDPVVLNSPWLRRGTGRFFRALFTLGQIGAWLCMLLPKPAVVWANAFPEASHGGMNRDIPLFALMAVCLTLSSGTSLWTSRESFRGRACSLGLAAQSVSSCSQYDGTTTTSHTSSLSVSLLQWCATAMFILWCCSWWFFTISFACLGTI